MKRKSNRIGLLSLVTALLIAVGFVFAQSSFSITPEIFASIGASTGSIAIVEYEDNNNGLFIFSNETITGNFHLTLSGDTLDCNEQIVGYYINPIWGSERVWPLYNQTLASLQANNEFTGVSMVGGFFTNCNRNGINPYAVFGYIEYNYNTESSDEEGYKIRAGITGIYNEPQFSNNLILVGGGEGSDLSASGVIIDSQSSLGFVTTYSGGNYSNNKPLHFGEEIIKLEFLAPAFTGLSSEIGDDTYRFSTGFELNMNLYGVEGYKWSVSGDLQNPIEGYFNSNVQLSTGILSSGTGEKDIIYTVLFDNNNDLTEIFSGIYKIYLSGGLPEITIIGPDNYWDTNKTISASATNNPTSFEYIVTTDENCNSDTDFNQAITYEGNNIVFSEESDNGKYVCFRAINNFGTRYAISAIINNIDRTKPTVTFDKNSGEPALAHSVTMTVNDNLAGLAAYQKIKYRWQSDNVCSTDEDEYSDIYVNPNTIGVTNATATVTTNGLETGNYYLCVLGETISDRAGNKNIASKTTGYFSINQGHGSATGNGLPLVQISIQPHHNRVPQDYVQIVWADGASGGFGFSDTNNSNYESWDDYTQVNTNMMGINLLDQSHNNKYLCALGQSGTTIQTVCSDYPIRIDTTAPDLSIVYPTDGIHLPKNSNIDLKWTGDDNNRSGISGFVLEINSPSGISSYNLSSGTFEKTISLSIAGTRTWSIEACDNVFNCAETSGYFYVDETSTPPIPDNTGLLVQISIQPHHNWVPQDYVQIVWADGASGGFGFSNTNNSNYESWDDYTQVNTNMMGINLLNQSHNNKYLCALGQYGTTIQTVCSDYPIRIDTTAPDLSIVYPNDGRHFQKDSNIDFKWTGDDNNRSGISGFVLEINSPSGTSSYNLSNSTFEKTISLSIAGTRTWSIKACDNVGNCNERPGYFYVDESTDTGQSTNNSGFYLISPTLFEEIGLGTDITFRWNEGPVNSGYTWNIEKIGGTMISSGSTNGLFIVLNSGNFSTGSYYRSATDIATDTTEIIPIFYVVDSGNIPDLKVDQFEFNEINDAEPDEYYTSNKIVIDGLDNDWYTFAYLKDDIGVLYINGEFVGTKSIVTNGDTIRIELKASSNSDETVSTKLIVGTGDNLISGDFKITTKNGIHGRDSSSLTPLQKLWGVIFVDSLVEMYQNDEEKLAIFLSTFMQILKDKSDYYAQKILQAQTDGDEDLVNEYKLYKNAVDFLYTIVKYRYDNIELEDRTVYIAPNGKQYLVEYDERRMAYTSPDFARPKYFPTRELFINHIDINNPAVGKWGIVGNVITTHNGKVYTIYETKGKWTSSNFKTAKYFDTKEDIINHILANNPASNWNHTVDPDFEQVTYTAPNGKPYRIFKTSSKGNNPNMYSSYDFVDAKYFTSLEAAKKFIYQNNQKK